MVDLQTVKRNWHQTIQVNFTLAKDQIEDIHALPFPIQKVIHRHSYFGLEVEELRHHFLPFLKNNVTNLPITVEYNGLPLLMHYPIGISYDLFAYDRDVVTVPWPLTIRFEMYQFWQYFKCPSLENIRHYFCKLFSEGIKAKNKAIVWKRLSHEGRESIWTGFYEHNFLKYWTVNSILMNDLNQNAILIPFFIYQLEKVTLTGKITPEEERSLMDLIKKYVPDVVDYIDKYHIFIQGFEIQLNVSLLWLSFNYSNPDSYLHIIIVPKVCEKSEYIKHNS